MNKSTSVSVVLVNWNNARFLSEAIRSVQQQSYQNWELIAVDNHSDDDSRDILERAAQAEDRISLLFLPHRQSYPAAINLGITQAGGELLARIDSDDFWFPAKLEAQVNFLRSQGRERVGVCGTDAVRVDATGKPLGPKRFPRTAEDCLRALWYRNPFCHSSVLIRTGLFGKCGLYDETFNGCEDLELWFRLGKCSELCNLDETLVGYRVWDGSVTNRRLRHIVWQSFRARAKAASKLGYHRPPLARLFSYASLAALVLPSRWVCASFELGLRWLGPVPTPSQTPHENVQSPNRAATAPVPVPAVAREGSCSHASQRSTR